MKLAARTHKPGNVISRKPLTLHKPRVFMPSAGLASLRVRNESLPGLPRHETNKKLPRDGEVPQLRFPLPFSRIEITDAKARSEIGRDCAPQFPPTSPTPPPTKIQGPGSGHGPRSGSGPWGQRRQNPWECCVNSCGAAVWGLSAYMCEFIQLPPI